MMNFISSFPPWFWMIIIAVLIGGLVFRLVKDGIKLKVGPVEIDATEEEKHEEAQKDEK